MIKWVEKEYSDYYQQDVVDITEEQKGYKRGYNTYTHSFIYRTLNVDAIKAFMSKNKYKTDQFNNESKPVNYYFSQLCKFNDAILFGPHQAKVPLPEVYDLEMQIYL